MTGLDTTMVARPQVAAASVKGSEPFVVDTQSVANQQVAAAPVEGSEPSVVDTNSVANQQLAAVSVEGSERSVVDTKMVAKPRIAAAGVYDPKWPRPPGLFPGQANQLGFMVSQTAPSAWESDKHITSGANVGNLVWALGAYQVLRAHDFVYNRSLWSPSSVDVLYIASGPLFPLPIDSPRVETIVRILDAVEKPTVVVGMGLAVRGLNCSAFSVGKGGWLDRFQKQIERHGGFVGVRGKCSETVLRRAGFTVFEALGCPSLFINQRPQLGARLEEKYRSLALRAQRRESFRIAIAMPNQYSQAVVHFLTRMFQFYPQTVLIVQEGSENGYIEKAVKEMGIEKPQLNSKWFYDAWAWHRDMASYDLVLAARIHGSMIGIAAETPVVTIAMDMRILEMAEFMELLHVLPSDPLLESDLPGFLAAVAGRFNGHAFDVQRSAIAARYRELFGKINVEGVLKEFA